MGFNGLNIMDQELHKALLEISTHLASQTAKLDAVKEVVEDHVRRDEAKFTDLYAKDSEHDKFQARTKGIAKGAGLLSTVAAAIVGVYIQLKGW
jgi:hypothetical protein